MSGPWVEGQRITLRRNDEEGWAEEEAIYIAAYGGTDDSHLVEVVDKEGRDDGLREVTGDQIK